MAASHEIDGLAAMESTARAQRRRLITAAIGRREIILAYRRLMLNADGTLKDDAAAVLGDLAQIANLGAADMPQASDEQLRSQAASRAIVLHMFARIDMGGTELKKLAKKLRENGQ
ncbi:hypothetical protein [Stakelama pacifica]|uniref:Bbp19-like phage domain-containing protein n=1 Tax=Stakelama pacifica TaxID=517720 RepID=A0A4R6FN02_9SPHN|nr:hypothetical protein [Stakelama pacifica]TDN82979.1 hypothetical protein EV664_105177 [Stakelama pacifica]GGO95018.1 hypothetical protein GCM10011329_18210 [Stakelama pacifica]